MSCEKGQFRSRVLLVKPQFKVTFYLLDEFGRASIGTPTVACKIKQAPWWWARKRCRSSTKTPLLKGTFRGSSFQKSRFCFVKCRFLFLILLILKFTFQMITFWWQPNLGFIQFGLPFILGPSHDHRLGPLASQFLENAIFCKNADTFLVQDLGPQQENPDPAGE